jgi:hypothetical protein
MLLSIFMTIQFVVQCQSAENSPTLCNVQSDSVQTPATEKVLFLKKNSDFGKAAVVTENRTITVMTKSGQKLKGIFSIKDSSTIEINQQLLSLDAISYLKVPRKNFRIVGGSIASTVTLIAVITFAVSGVPPLGAIPFAAASYIIFSASKKYDLQTVYSIQVLRGGPN